MMALYVHLGPFSQFVVARIGEQIDDVDSGRWQKPQEIAPAASQPIRMAFTKRAEPVLSTRL